MSGDGGFEWEIAKLLSECWNNEGRDDIFIPTDSSGARSTRRRKSNKETAFRTGDITFSDPIGKPLIDIWSMELKHGYTKKKKKTTSKSKLDGSDKETIQRVIETPWDSLELIDSKQSQTQFEEFWEQCLKDAQSSNREPVLIFRRNKRQPCICFRLEYFFKFTSLRGNFSEKQIRIYDDDPKICVNLYTFLDWIGNLNLLCKHLIRK